MVNPATATPVPTAPPSQPIIDSFNVTPAQIETGQCVQITWNTSGATWLVRLLRNNVLVLDNAALAGSAQDCLQYAGSYTYQLVASTASGQSVIARPVRARDRSAADEPAGRDQTFGLDALNGAPIVTGSNITVTFKDDGTLNGFGGCNNYSGRYTANNGQITVSEVNQTNIFCADPAGVMEQEGAYINALRAAATFEIPGMSLQLIVRNAAGQEILRYIMKLTESRIVGEGGRVGRPFYLRLLRVNNMTRRIDPHLTGR